MTIELGTPIAKNDEENYCEQAVDQLTPGYEVDEGFVEICPNTCEPILVVSFYREAHWPVK